LSCHIAALCIHTSRDQQRFTSRKWQLIGRSQWAPQRIEHLYSPRLVGEIKEGKIGTANEQTVMWPN